MSKTIDLRRIAVFVVLAFGIAWTGGLVIFLTGGLIGQQAEYLARANVQADATHGLRAAKRLAQVLGVDRIPIVIHRSPPHGGVQLHLSNTATETRHTTMTIRRTHQAFVHILILLYVTGTG